MYVITVTGAAGGKATPIIPAGVAPDKLKPFQTIVVVCSGSGFLGDAAVSGASNGIPVGSTPLVIPANTLQYASDLNEIFVSGATLTFVIMVFP